MSPEENKSLTSRQYGTSTLVSGYATTQELTAAASGVCILNVKRMLQIEIPEMPKAIE